MMQKLALQYDTRTDADLEALSSCHPEQNKHGVEAERCKHTSLSTSHLPSMKTHVMLESEQQMREGPRDKAHSPLSVALAQHEHVWHVDVRICFGDVGLCMMQVMPVVPPCRRGCLEVQDHKSETERKNNDEISTTRRV